jgi:hypothetical protein
MAITRPEWGRPARSAGWCTACEKRLTAERTAWTRPGTGGPRTHLASVVICLPGDVC